MDAIAVNFVVGLSSAFIFSGATSVITKKVIEKTKNLEMENKYLTKVDTLKKDVISTQKEEEGYKAILNNEYLRGKEDGSKEERNRFSICYTPFIDITDSFLKTTADAGIEMQIFYGGLPVADPMRRVTKHEEKCKEENIKYLIDKVNENIKVLADLATSHQIPVKITQEPKRESTKKGKKKS
jgi:hypothetical protein